MTEPSKRGPNGSTARTTAALTLVVTNITKLAGVVVGVHAGFQPVPDVRVMALAVFMMAGAHVSERVLLTAIQRFLGLTREEEA